MAFESLGKIFSLKNMKNSFKKEIPSCPKKSWNNRVILARLVETRANENDLNLNKLIKKLSKYAGKTIFIFFFCLIHRKVFKYHLDIRKTI